MLRSNFPSPQILLAFKYTHKLIPFKIWSVFTHVTSSKINLLEPEDVFIREKGSAVTGVVWVTISAAVLMFWDTDMADVLSCENAGSTGDTNLAPRVLLKRGKQRILGTRIRKNGHTVYSCILRHLQVGLKKPRLLLVYQPTS